MSVFRFKRFSVSNELSSMKVNTDGVLLGSATTIYPADRTILDVGTGTGTIALMLAQRYDEKNSLSGKQLIGIDIDKMAAEEAQANFKASPWAANLIAIQTGLETLRDSNFQPTMELDLIVSNPPFFENSLKTPDIRRSLARHSDSLSYKDLLEYAKCHLSAQGRLSMILPSDQGHDLLRYARMCSLFPFRILHIRTTPRKPVTRMIAEFSFERNAATEEELTIHNQSGEYSSDYQDLTGPFYL